jgi:transposase
MSILRVGVDVSQDTLDVARIIDNQENCVDLGTFTNDEEGFVHIEKTIQKEAKQADADQIQIIVEPTGGYEQRFVKFALKKNWRVNMPNPFKVRQWAKGMGIRAKTDRVDARMLARYGVGRPLHEYKPLPPEIARLDSLLTRKEELEENLRREENRLHARKSQGMESVSIIESLERTISWLQEEIARIEEQINGFLKEHPDVDTRLKNIKTVPGVGERNALFFLILMYQWDTNTDGKGTAKQLTAYLGLDSVPVDSGTSVHKRPAISKEGNRKLRCRFYMSAFGAIHGKSPLSEFYHRLVANGKKKKLALVAGARKILVWTWATFRNNTTFDDHKALPASN